MAYRGHVEKGVIVLDEATPLRDGMRVTVLPVETDVLEQCSTSLRGTAYRFDDPFTPAAEADEWDSAR